VVLSISETQKIRKKKKKKEENAKKKKKGVLTIKLHAPEIQSHHLWFLSFGCRFHNFNHERKTRENPHYILQPTLSASTVSVHIRLKTKSKF